MGTSLLSAQYFCVSNTILRKSLVVQWLGRGAFTAMGQGLIRSWGTKVLWDKQCSQKIKTNKQTNPVLKYIFLKSNESSLTWPQPS